MASIELQAVKGTRDFYPLEARRQQWLFGLWREIAGSFGYEPYDACVLEHEELYTRKAGDEITQQLYCFEDKGGRRVSLRPEMTPSLARMVMARQGILPLPLRWYAIPQCFRYERMQRGRKREHFQWNMDVVGLDHVAAEVELMQAQATFLRRAGLDLDAAQPEAVWRVSDRRVLQDFLASLGIAGEQFAAVCVIVDKRDKIGREATATELAALGVAAEPAGRILDLLELTSLDALAAAVGEANAGVRSLRTLLALAEAAGMARLVRIDPSIVRGLSYYTGTVWEVFAEVGSIRRAVAGGGRYNQLLATLGGKQLPMVGFGLGDVVILDLLEELQRLPPDLRGLDDVIYPMAEGGFATAVRIATKLRAQGRRVAVDFTLRRFKHVIQAAEGAGAARLLILGESELAAGQCKIRDLATREETAVELASF